MLHVGVPRSLHGVEVAVDDPIQVLRYSLRDFVEFRVVEGLGLLIDILGEGDGGQVAHRSLVFVGVLNDFGTVSCENTVKYTPMPEWFVETERICDVSKIFDRDNLLKVKCLTIWLLLGIKVQALRL